MDIFNPVCWNSAVSVAEQSKSLWLYRETHTYNKLIHQSHCYSLRNRAQCLQQKTCVWHTISKNCEKNEVCVGEVGCVKNRCFEAFKCGKQEARPVSEASHLAYGFHWHETKPEHVCVFCCVKDGLPERQERSGYCRDVTHPITARLNTALLCDCPPSSLHTGTSV